MTNKKNSTLIILFFLVISGIWIAPGILNIGDFLFHPNAQFSDVLISHWPNAQFIRDALKTWKAFPLWNPLILSGSPLVGDPLFGIWYAPNWLTYLLPIGIAINILFWLHLTWAGLGMFYWMRSESIHWGAALVAGVALSGMPKLVGHIGLGHLSLVSSIAWTPWLLLATRRIVFSLSAPRKEGIKWFALGGAVAGILFIADPRWILPASVLAILYAIRTNHHERLGIQIFSSRWIISGLVGILIFIGMISGLAIPMIEFTLRSTRMDLSLDEITQLSLPLQNLVGVLIPQYGTWPETITYGGLIILGLAMIALLGRSKGWLFWLGIGLASLILALGNQTPIYSFLHKVLPIVQFLRVPARFSFLGFFSLITLAGLGLDLIVQKRISPENRRWIRLGLVGFCILILLLGVGSMFILNNIDRGKNLSWFHMIFAAVLMLGIGFYSLSKDIRTRIIITLWIFPVFFDLLLMDRSLLEIRSMEEVFGDREVIANVLCSCPSQERIFSPSYSIPQNIGAAEGLQLADGVNPLQLKAYWEYMATAVGFDPAGYSVTLPPFPDGDPRSPQYKDIDPVALGLLNVGYIISEYPLSIKGLGEVEEIQMTHIYWNSDVRPRAWIELGSEDSVGAWRTVEEMEWSPNHISIVAKGGGLLVLSEIVYPGWEAFVDGDKVEIELYREILRSVPLDPGEHDVEFYYRPISVRLGLFITLLTLIVFVFLWLRR